MTQQPTVADALIESLVEAMSPLADSAENPWGGADFCANDGNLVRVTSTDDEGGSFKVTKMTPNGVIIFEGHLTFGTTTPALAGLVRGLL